MEPIEEGCLAVIIRSYAGNAGKEVTVGKFIGGVPGFRHTDIWEVDIFLDTIFGERVQHCPESNLLRIDGYEETVKDLNKEVTA